MAVLTQLPMLRNRVLGQRRILGLSYWEGEGEQQPTLTASFPPAPRD